MAKGRRGSSVGKPVVGDVVIVPFPFSDLSASKRRPAMVVAGLGGDDAILCMVTCKLHGDPFAIRLSQEDFVSGSLPVDSVIRPTRLFTADLSIVAYTAGSLSSEKVDLVLQHLRWVFGGPALQSDSRATDTVVAPQLRRTIPPGRGMQSPISNPIYSCPHVGRRLAGIEGCAGA